MIEVRLDYAQIKGDQYGIEHWSNELIECNKLIEKEKQLDINSNNPR